MTEPTPDSSLRTLRAFAPLRPTEQLVLQCCRTGEIAKIGLRLPRATAREHAVRAAFVAALLRAGVLRHGQRLQVVGAVVEGRLDLGDAEISGSLWFYRCRFDAPVLLDGARVSGSVTFSACRMAALLAERCEIGADLVLNAGTSISQDLRLTQARVGGHLDATRLNLTVEGDLPATRRALSARGLRVDGDLLLSDRFQAIGEVHLVDARIGGDLHASGLFNGCPLDDGGRGVALVLDRAEVRGSMLLDADFNAAGSVRLVRAHVHGDLDATGASFDWLGDAGWGDGASLALDRARVDGALILRKLRTPLLGASFVDARVGTLADDGTTWGDHLSLDGFAYSRLDDEAPLDTMFRVGWLECQKPAHLSSHFRMQPWRRLIHVLDRMGHAHHARSIALRREHRLRTAGRIGSWAPRRLRWVARAGHWLMGVLAGHGYRPGRLVAWAVGVWLISAAVYGAAVAWGGGSSPVADPVIDPLGYSLDRLLPLVALGYGSWAAADTAWSLAVQWLARLEAGFGWGALLLFLASIAGWTDRDRRR